VRRPHAPVPPPPDEIEPDRTDLRDLFAFTIDPDEAKDFDDALSFRREGEGIRAWVHIADVSAYVPAGSPLDRDAADRAFSSYVPAALSRCFRSSLGRPLQPAPGPGSPLRDRRGALRRRPLARRAALLPQRDQKPRAAHVLTSQAILAGIERAPDETTEVLRLAERVAQELRCKRYARGALRIEAGETAFEFDGDGGVERAWIEDEPLAHSLVEEMMILANEAVAGPARRAKARGAVPRARAAGAAVGRAPPRQARGARGADAPVPEQLTPGEAAKLAAAVSERVADYTEQSGRGRQAFPSLVLRALKQARYDPRNLGHSGLASRAYCHFTSPIRRYPDLVVHRALLRELGISDEPFPDELEELAEWTSVRERELSSVEYKADEICLAWLLERRLFEEGWEAEFDGEIVGAIGSGVFVRFDAVFEGYVPARKLPGDYFELNPLATALVGRRRGFSYRLGDGIRVRVERIEKPSGGSA
jgi:ribonuclease R